MARSWLSVQYLVFCESVEYLDPARPHRDSILNRVDYVLGAPANTEFSFEPPEFWLFARFFSQSDVPRTTRPLTISCVWRDHPSGHEVEIWKRDLGPVRFSHPFGVIDRAWPFRNHDDDVRYRFPGIGWYEFQMWYPVRKGSNRRIVAREHIRVEVLP